MTRYSYEKNGNHAQKLQGFIYLKGTENRKRSVNPFKGTLQAFWGFQDVIIAYKCYMKIGFEFIDMMYTAIFEFYVF